MKPPVSLHREVCRYRPSCVPLLILVSFTVAAVCVLNWTSPRRGPRCYDPTTSDYTHWIVEDYAESAYPIWKRNNRGRDCPDRLRDLNEYTVDGRIDDVTDAWGYDLRVSCDAKGLRVWSIGEDGRADTGDDIRSWD